MGGKFNGYLKNKMNELEELVIKLKDRPMEADLLEIRTICMLFKSALATMRNIKANGNGFDCRQIELFEKEVEKLFKEADCICGEINSRNCPVHQ